MMVLADTSVWSIAVRHTEQDLSAPERSLRNTFEKVIAEGRVALIGPIRQELLTGIREERQFHRLREALRAFPETELTIQDYEEAARLSNICRSHGVAGNPTDFLICSVARLRNWVIFTRDQDFARYARHIPIRVTGLH